MRGAYPRGVDDWIQRHLTLSPGAVASLFEFVTAFGTFWVLLVVIVVVLHRRRRALVATAVALVVSRVVVSWLKATIDRDRPPEIDRLVHATGQAMPSGHAANVAAVALGIAVAFPRWRWPAFGVAAVVGVSRVLLGVHWASDVIAGWVVGAVISGACALSVSPASRRFRRPSSPAGRGS